MEEYYTNTNKIAHSILSKIYVFIVDKTRAHFASRGGRILGVFEENFITPNSIHIKAKYKAYRTEKYVV